MHHPAKYPPFHHAHPAGVRINMYCWSILALLALVGGLQGISMDSKHSYRLQPGQNYTQVVQPHQRLRYTFVQLHGRAQLALTTSDGTLIATHSQSIAEGTIAQSTAGVTLRVSAEAAEVTAGGAASGFVQVWVARTMEELRAGEEKIMEVVRGEARVVQVRPSEQPQQLLIQRFDGMPLFISNLCEGHERKECLDEMHRFTAAPLTKHVEVVPLRPCPNCILLVKVNAHSPRALLRLSLAARRSTLATHPTLLLIRKGQAESISVSGRPGDTGRVTVYSGAVGVSSAEAELEGMGSGFRYVMGGEESPAEGVLAVKGEAALSYLMVENPSDATEIQLFDGLPATRLLQPGVTYSLSYENAQEGRSNIVLSGSTDTLQRLTISFALAHSPQRYLIKPRFHFHSNAASQNFRVGAAEGAVLIELRLSEGSAAWVGATAEVNEHISLPLEYSYSSILDYNEYDDYVFEGVSGPLEVEIRKCVDCPLKYALSEDPIASLPKQAVLGSGLVESRNLSGDHLYLRVYSSNYAYYSVQARRPAQAPRVPAVLPQDAVSFYLTEDSPHNLLLEFAPPLCGQQVCPSVKYYLLEGSDLKHLSSKVYCPFSLFDFDERTKDIVVQAVEPTAREGGVVEVEWGVRHRDYLGVVAEVEGQLLGYRVVDTGEVKLYREMRWPIFYLCLFLTCALLCSFVAFMALRRKSHAAEGYVRTSSGGSLEALA